jgi:hypothetical protein
MDKFSTLCLYEQGSRLGLLPYLPSVEMSAKVKTTIYYIKVSRLIKLLYEGSLM